MGHPMGSDRCERGVLKMLSECIPRCLRSRLQQDELAQLNPPSEGRKAAFNRGE